jgi:NhaP-type Na+/H+ or K+/H+ antiporter
MTGQLAILAVFVFLFSIFAGRIERSFISGPMIFVFSGILMGPMFLGWFSGEGQRSMLRLLADVTLSLFLFTDAANANLSVLKRRFGIPSRMLLIGLPGVIVLGFLLALVTFDTLTVYEAALLGTMLAATDAALGKPVFTHPSVPAQLREGLNVESGLNDGLCVPILFVFIALELGSEYGSGGGLIIRLLAQELGIGLLVGGAVAVVGAWLIQVCERAGWVSKLWLQVSAIALAIACYAIAQSLHGSGYIAAFTGGMAFGYITEKQAHELTFTAEAEGQTFALLTWFLFGSAITKEIVGQFSWEIVAYALLSLTLVRMLPIYLCLAGTGEPIRNRLFLGWFGPRGLASIVFAVIVLDNELEGAPFIALIVICTVLFSLVLHGITSNPIASRMKSCRS